MATLLPRNATAIAKDWMGSPVGQLALVQLEVIANCLIIGILILLGSWRRSSGWFLRALVWVAYLYAYSMFDYIYGAMQSANFRNELLVAWACLLLLLLGTPNSITAYSPSDKMMQLPNMLHRYVHVIYVLYFLASYTQELSVKFKVLFYILWAASCAKLSLWAKAYFARSKELSEENEKIYDSVQAEKELRTDDPESMSGYEYTIIGEVTAQQVWRCEGRLLSSGSSSAQRKKDLCLSLALFKMLRLRFHKAYGLSQLKPDKAHKFVLRGLVAKDEDVKRAFRVIKIELGFLYDFIYTRYPSSSESLFLEAILYFVVIATLFTFFAFMLHYHTPRGNINLSIHHVNVDILLTRAIIILFMFLESYQFLAFSFSDWIKVKMLCRYAWRPTCLNYHLCEAAFFFESLCEQLSMLFCHVGAKKKYWNKTMTQYSLLDHAGSHPVKHSLSVLTFGVFDELMVTESVRLSQEVKLALAAALRKSTVSILSYGRLNNALESESLKDTFGLWNELLENKSYSERILTWHVATGLCQYALCKDGDRKAAEAEEFIGQHYWVATELSNYCAYLVAFSPKLLAGHSHRTQLTYDNELRHARYCLRGCMSRSEKYQRMLDLKPFWEADHDKSHFADGMRIGFKLMAKTNGDVKLRWKVLADVWAELMLFVTPADNALAHAEKLATGGELITHLWALLTHAGIIEPAPLWLEEDHPWLHALPESRGLLPSDKKNVVTEREMAIPEVLRPRLRHSGGNCPAGTAPIPSSMIDDQPVRRPETASTNPGEIEDAGKNI